MRRAAHFCRVVRKTAPKRKWRSRLDPWLPSIHLVIVRPCRKSRAFRDESLHPRLQQGMRQIPVARFQLRAGSGCPRYFTGDPVTPHFVRCGWVSQMMLALPRRSRPALLEQLRGKLVQVIAPVDPGVRTRALFEDRLETVFLQQLNGRLGVRHQAIVDAGAQPYQPRALFQSDIVEIGFVGGLPIRTRLLRRRGCRRDCRRCTASAAAPQGGTGAVDAK